LEKFWEKKGIHFECQGSGACCKYRGSYSYVYLDLEDRRRMAKFFKLPVASFTKKYCEKDEGYFYLKNPQADCEFLDQKKCTIYEARPKQCRTWPFWPELLNNEKVWNEDVKTFCKGIGKGKLYTPEEIKKIAKSAEMK
jgi:Fe-S-cluster containining protein